MLLFCGRLLPRCLSPSSYLLLRRQFLDIPQLHLERISETEIVDWLLLFDQSDIL